MHLTSVTFHPGRYPDPAAYPFNIPARRCGVHIWREGSRLRVGHNRWEERLHEYLDAEWASNDPGQLAYFGGHSLMTLSHGQSLMAFFRSRYRLRGLYLLDEPGAALWSFDAAPPAPVRYQDTRHVRVYRDFLADPARFLEVEAAPDLSGAGE